MLRIRALVLLFGVLTLLVAVWPRPVIADELTLAVIVSRRNPTQHVSTTTLKQVFTAALRFWPSGDPVVPINYPPGDPMRVAFDRALLGMEPDRVGKYWVDQLVRARAQPPRKMTNPSLVVRVVAQLAGAVGYVPLKALTPDVRVVAYVKHGEVVAP